MKFQTEVLWTLAIQGAGALAAFAAIAWLGAALGPVPQGVFSRTKVEVEFIAAVATLGLPQALFYYLRQQELSLRKSTMVSWAGAAACIPVGGLYAMVSANWTAADAVFFVIAAVASVLHANLRAVTLAVASAQVFNVVTAAPQILVLAYVTLAIAIGRVDSTEASLAIGLCFCVGVALAIRAIVRSDSWKAELTESVVGTPRLIRYGAATWLSSVLFTASTLLCMRSAESDLDATSLGVFSMALALAQVAITPLNYSLPLLFKRWTGVGANVSPVRIGAIVSLVPLSAAGLAFVLNVVAPEAHLLGAYSPVLSVLWIMLIGVSAEGLFRILSVASNASNNPQLTVVADVLRVLSVAGVLCFGGIKNLHDVAVAWMSGCAVAAVCLVVLWALVVRRTRLTQ